MRRRGRFRRLATTAALTSTLALAMLGQGSVAVHAMPRQSGGSAAEVAELPWLPWPPWGHPNPRMCMALYNVTQEKEGSFKATVEVMNHTTDPMVGWSVTWKPSDGTHLTRVHGGWLWRHSDGTVTVRSTLSTFYIPPHDQEVTFSFTARSEHGYNFPNGSMKCTSP